ncbi:hypothetical protein [Spirochaeta cellobiosiphila]|uniref:hypothetical protein n=1 Tax=Spirochaeta cellobiosiphila TaxID=504483 RepID=UPI0004205807|nr:hypothetical protein [Spirochaeta cellobiosiphila]
MGDNFQQIPVKLQDHIKRLVKIAGLPDNDDSLELLSGGWLEKQEAFEQELEKLGLITVEELAKDDPKGALVLTYSGSLVNIGPLMEGNRKASYASIGLREDVPEAAENADSELTEDIVIDGEVHFSKGPIKKSSPIYQIAILKEDMDPADEESILDEATMIITENFIEVNKTMVVD